MRTVIVIGALLISGAAFAKCVDAPQCTLNDLVGTYSSNALVLMPPEPSTNGPVNDDFKRGACWLAHKLYPQYVTSSNLAITIPSKEGNITCD